MHRVVDDGLLAVHRGELDGRTIVTARITVADVEENLAEDLEIADDLESEGSLRKANRLRAKVALVRAAIANDDRPVLLAYIRDNCVGGTYEPPGWDGGLVGSLEPVAVRLTHARLVGRARGRRRSSRRTRTTAARGGPSRRSDDDPSPPADLAGVAA